MRSLLDSSVTVIGRTSEISVDGNELNELFSKRSTTWLTHQTPNHTGFIESLCRTNLFPVKAGRGSHSNFYCYPVAAFIVQSFLTLFQVPWIQTLDFKGTCAGSRNLLDGLQYQLSSVRK